MGLTGNGQTEMELGMVTEIRTALVVEGGGMRGVFAAGVLDSFLEAGFDPFDAYVGVSAGACNLSSHLAGQYMRNYRCYTDYMLHREFMSLPRFLRGGHYLDLDWFWEHGRQVDPLHVVAACRKPFYIVATDTVEGSPVYASAEPDTLLEVLKGSSALPLLYRGGVVVGGKTFVDGGVTDPLPVAFAVRKGARRVMVIRSRPCGYVKRNVLESVLGAWLFRGNKPLKGSLLDKNQRYNEAVAFIRNPPAGVDILEVCPARLRSSRTTRSLAALQSDYQEGKRIGKQAIAQWESRGRSTREANA